MSANNKFYFSLLFCIALSLIELAAQAVAQVSDQPAAGYGMTSGRFVASSAALLGLAGVVIGVLALVCPAGRFGTASGRLAAILTLAAGLISTAVGGLIVATAGGFGTGGGRAGAIVAVVLGLVAIVLGGLALSRSRPTG